MPSKIIQKHLLKGTQELEIVDDAVQVRIKSPLGREERFSVVLSILNPDPVVRSSYLDFHSRVSCGPLISLYMNKPNPEVFNAFVGTLRQRALEEYSAFAGIKMATPTVEPAGNSYDEPPEFDESDATGSLRFTGTINTEEVDTAIRMLETHLESEGIQPLISALDALKEDPDSESLRIAVVGAFNDLGPLQGAVLTYAPYLNSLMSDDPFGSDAPE